MQVFDASSMIHAWDNYPIRQFPGLWEWMASQIKKKNVAMPNVAFQEVEYKTPECGKWLKQKNIELLPTNNSIIKAAMRIKKLLGIVDDKYHAKGVDENDLLIIATAKVRGEELISDEVKQTTPKMPAKQRIPAVCLMQEVNVPCLNFIEFIKRSNTIFR